MDTRQMYSELQDSDFRRPITMTPRPPADIRHVIWDWNGTLLDDAWLCVEVLNGLLRERGMSAIVMPDYREHFDFPVIRYYQRLGFDFERDSFERVSEQYIGAYNRRRYECGLHEGTLETLGALRAAGVTQSVLSAYHQTTLEEVLGHYGVRPYLEHVSGQDNILAHGKIDLGHRHLAKLGHKASEVLLVGDTVHDYEVARALGIHCVLVEHGHHAPSRLSACGVPAVKDQRALRELILPWHAARHR